MAELDALHRVRRLCTRAHRGSYQGTRGFTNVRGRYGLFGGNKTITVVADVAALPVLTGLRALSREPVFALSSVEGRY